MGPTNQETLLWLKSLTGLKYSSSTLEEAKSFFGSFEGDHKKFNLWKENFNKEHKKLKQGIHTQLMKACGGTGSHFDIPPTDFLPQSMTIGDKCAQCDENFENDTLLKEHIKSNHKDHLKRAYSKEALEFVLKDPKYVDWLNKTTSVTEGRNAITMTQMQESNKLLAEKLNSQTKYTMVKESNGISEMKKNHVTTQNDGTVKISVIKEQFINVTSRKRALSNEEKKSINTEKHKSIKVKNIVKHVAGENSEKQARVVAKYLDREGPQFAAAVSKQSKHLNAQAKFSPEETAAITAGTNTPASTMDRLRTAHNNKFGSNPFASRHRVEKVQKDILIVNREDWEASEHDLYIHKQGNSVNEKKKTTVFTVKNLQTYIEKHAESEKDNLKHLKDMEEIVVCYDGDGGGGRFVFEFAFLNNIDRKVKLHPILIYEGTDTRPNLEVTLGKLTSQNSWKEKSSWLEDED